MSTAETAPAARRQKTRPIVIATLVVLFLLVLSVLGYRWALKGGLATLTESQGTPERDYASSMQDWRVAEIGDDFDSGDGARTDQNETAVFRLTTGAILTLKPASQIRFQAKGQGKAQTLGILVDVGEADVKTNEGSLTIDSQFGPIVIDANTTVSMRRNGAQLAVAVELGSITLGEDGQRVSAGQAVDVELGGLVLDPEEEDGAAPKEDEPEENAPTETPLEVGNGIDRADLVVAAGKSFTVHDPSPPTAVGISVKQLCNGGPARLTVGKQKTEAKGQANLALASGKHSYEVRCLDAPEQVAASGSINILQDAGTKTLPSFAPSANVTTDGRRYTVLYQQRLPQVTVSWANAPAASSYTLQVDGRNITTKSPNYTFSAMPPGTHKLTFSAASDPPRQSRATTVAVTYDAQAPAARVAMPPGGYDPGAAVEVAGQALPGWTVSVDGKELEVDSQRRFSQEVTPSDSLPIEFSHPTHGTHYYLRRSKTSSK